MKAAATANLVIFLIVYGIAVFIGIDPKKWQTWLLSLYGFLTFFLVGIIGTGNVYEAVKVSAIATFALIFGGIITFWNRERSKKWLQEHEAKELESIQKLDMRISSKKESDNK